MAIDDRVRRPTGAPLRQRPLVGRLWASACSPSSWASGMIGSGGTRAPWRRSSACCWCSARWPCASCAPRAGAPDRRSVEQTLLALYALGLRRRVALRGPVGPAGRPRSARRSSSNWPKLATVLARAVAGALGRGGLADPARRAGLRADGARARAWSWAASAARCCPGFGLAGALVFAFSFAYVASERDKKVDLAYFRTTRPGEVTRRIVRNLDQPIEVAVVLPGGNEVREEVDDYLDDLAKESGQLKVTHYDFDIDPIEGQGVRRLQQRRPGVRPRHRARSSSACREEIEGAKTALKTLDKEVQQRLHDGGQAAAHGGLHRWATASAPGRSRRDDTDKRAGITTLRDVLRRSDLRRPLRSAPPTASCRRSPRTSRVLVIIGPQKPFLPEELAALNRFIDGGGRAAHRARSREQRRHARGARAAGPRVSRREPLANEQAFARRTAPETATAPTW